jgi:SHS2 domain-containing protein
VKEPDGKAPFRELDHTADLRIEILGRDEPELFRNAVDSLYILLGLPVVSDQSEHQEVDELRILGQDPEESLVQLLGELLYRATVERRQLTLDTLSVRRGGEGESVCEVILAGRWRKLLDEEMTDKREIKAVTYHNVEIRRTRKGLSARLVMDT